MSSRFRSDTPKSNGCVWKDIDIGICCGANMIIPGDRDIGSGAAVAVGGDVPCIGWDIVCLTAGAGYIREASYMDRSRDECAGGGGPTGGGT